MDDGGVSFLIGGSRALSVHTGVTQMFRARDLDLMIRPCDWSRAARALRTAGIDAELSFPHWLGKARRGSAQVDLIFSSGNGVATVDDAWFRRAVPAHVLGADVRIVPPEELLWSKAFVMERERFDGADVLHLMVLLGNRLDWRHLLKRFRGHEPVLLAHVVLFHYVYPGRADWLPRWLLGTLFRAASPRARVGPYRRLCRGTLLSRQQYLVDVTKWGLIDGRRPPFGKLSDRDLAIWTAAIEGNRARAIRTKRPMTIDDPPVSHRVSRAR